MAGGIAGYGGGIFGVLDELDAYPQELTADLWRAGLDIEEIGSGRTTWLHVVSIIKTLPVDSAYVFAKHGEKVLWDAEKELLAQIKEGIDFIAWVQAGAKPGRRPKPVPRPGEKTKTHMYGQDESWTPESFDQWLELVEGAA